MKLGLYIDGQYVETPETKEIVNPYSKEVFAEVCDGQPQDMNRAIASAYEAFKIMKRMPAVERAEILYRAAHLLDQKKEEFAKLITFEAAKPISASRTEVERSVQTLTFSAEEAKKIAGEYIPMDAAVGGAGRDAYTILQPLGVVGAITPFNFPLNLAVHKIGPAIASGNTIVVKPASQTPLSALKLAELFTRAGLPDGAFNVVPGSGSVLGDILVEDERVQKISFTGSPRIGKELKRKAGLKRVTLELGSNSALYIDESMIDQLDTVVEKAVSGAFAYNGQVCIHTQRIYIHENIAEAFISQFIQQAKNVPFGDPLDEKTMVTAMIDDQSKQRVLEWVEEAINNGAELLLGGEEKETGIVPTVLKNATESEKVVCEEIFGPVVVINIVSSADEALKRMNRSKYGLNAGVFTNHLPQALYFAHELEVGQVLINDTPTLRFDHMPYGGVKESGYGHEGVKYAIREMTKMKLISLNYQL